MESEEEAVDVGVETLVIVSVESWGIVLQWREASSKRNSLESSTMKTLQDMKTRHGTVDMTKAIFSPEKREPPNLTDLKLISFLIMWTNGRGH